MGKKLFGFDTDKVWDYENGFYLTSDITRIGKLMAHFELYKSIINLPGHVIECGVYKGASLIRWTTFRELLESPHSRKIIGFDAFGKFPQQENESDSRFANSFEQNGGDGIPVDELDVVLKRKEVGNYELIEGNILETVPAYVAEHPELRISLLHIDVDVYSPTVAIMNHLYERVVRNGLVVLDDYGTVEGETRAIDEFVKDRDITIEKLPSSHIPSFIRK